jgi:hypothetical protein
MLGGFFFQQRHQVVWALEITAHASEVRAPVSNGQKNDFPMQRRSPRLCNARQGRF